MRWLSIPSAGGGDDLRCRRLPCRQGRRERIAAGQLTSHALYRARPAQRVFLEALYDHALNLRIDVRDGAGWVRRCVFLVLACQLGKGRALEDALAGEQLVQQSAQGVDLAAHGQGMAADLLGGHVGRRAGSAPFLVPC